MPFLCEVCQSEMEPIKQKYVCQNCHHIKPCCEGEVCHEKFAESVSPRHKWRGLK